ERKNVLEIDRVRVLHVKGHHRARIHFVESVREPLFERGYRRLVVTTRGSRLRHSQRMGHYNDGQSAYDYCDTGLRTHIPLQMVKLLPAQGLPTWFLTNQQ